MPSPSLRISICPVPLYALILFFALGISPTSGKASAVPLPDSLQAHFLSLDNSAERKDWLNQQISLYTSQTPPIAEACMLLLAEEFEGDATPKDSAIALQLRAKAAFLSGNGLKAFDYAQASLCKLEQIDAPFERARSYFLAGIITSDLLKDHSIAAYYNELGLAICPPDYPNLINPLTNNLAMSLVNSGQSEKAALILEKAITDLDSTSSYFEFQWRWLQNTLGTAYHSLGRTKQALKAYQNALVFARKGTDKNLIGSTAMNISMIFVDLEAPIQALLYLREAENAFQDFSTIYLIQVYEQLGMAHLMLDSLEAVETDLKRMGEIIEQMHQMQFQASMHNLEVQLWSKRNQPRKAITLAEDYLSHPNTPQEQISLELLILENYLLLAENQDISSEEGEFENFGSKVPSPATLAVLADTLLNKALDAGMYGDLKQTYKALARFYQHEGNAAKAVEMNRRAIAMADSLLPASEFAQMQAETFEFEVKQRDQQLRFQQDRIKLQAVQLAYQRQRSYLLYSLLGGLCLLFVMGGIFFYGRIKLNRQLKSTNQELREANSQLQTQSRQIREQANQVQQQSDIILAQKEALQEELSSRERELATREVLRHRNERLLEALDKDLQDISPYVQPAGRKPLKEARDKLRLAPRGTRDWEVFREQFERIHPNFFQHLTQNYPKLSAVDLRQCAYIRLGMDKHEMANLLNLTIRGVESARYRIRKKLELKTGESLDSYLQSL